MNAKYDHLSDVELMRQARRRKAPYEVIYRRHAGDIYNWALGHIGDAQVAADLTAETFAIGWEQRASFSRGATDSVRPWLFGIAHNVFRMWARSQSTEAKALRRLGVRVRTDDWSADIAHGVLGNDDELLSALGDADREAVSMRVIDGLSYRDIATRLTCSQPAARMRVMRGLQSLRNIHATPGDTP